jgi:hypothetical protein
VLESLERQPYDVVLLEKQGKTGSINGAESMIPQIQQAFNHAQMELMHHPGVTQTI